MAQPTVEELLKRIAELESANARPAGLAFKVGEKGGISIYGMSRFPLTQYWGQYQRLAKLAFGMTDEQLAASPLGKFAAAHKDKLAVKAAKE